MTLSRWWANDDNRYGLIAIVWLVLVFLSDLYTRLGLAHGILYLPAILFAVRIPSPFFSRSILAFAVAGTIAVIFLAPDKPADLPASYVYANRILAIFALCMTYLLTRSYKRLKHESRELEQQQYAQQRYFENLVENLPVQIWTATPEGAVDYVGDRLVEFTGLPREEILACWQSLLHPDDRARATEVWQAAVSSQAPYLIDFRLRRHDGEYIWFKTGANLALDASQQADKWFGFAIDINDLVQLHSQAEQLTEKYQHTVESITDAFFTLDSQFRFTYLNHKAAEVLGGTPNELAGQSIWNSCPPENHQTFASRLYEVYENQAALYFETFYSPKKCWLDVRAYPSPEGITVYFVDTTVQKQERERLNLLSTAVSRLNDIIMITEADPIDEPGPKTVFVNEAFIKKTGFSKADIIGKSPRLLQGPKTQRAELDRIKHALKHWQPVRAQLLNYTKSGDEYWLELDIVPITNDAGQYTHWVSVERDITEQKHLHEQLMAAQRMESIGQLTGGISHDFNNLLTVILTNAELLEEELADQPRLKKVVSLICQAAEKGSSLTQHLLAFARRQPLLPVVVDVENLLTDLLPLLEASVGENSELHLSLASELWPIVVDPTQLENCMLNLTLNAQDALRASGTITIQARNYVNNGVSKKTGNPAELLPGEYVEISLSDTGRGMQAELVEQIFEPFFSTKPEGRGSGLGLSMVYGFVKQSGGHISVHSEPDIGTTFCLYLPKADGRPQPTEPSTQQRAKQPAEQATDPQSKDTPATAASRGKTILVVEDDPEIRNSATQVLSRVGYQVHASENAQEALDLLIGGLTPDLVFTDIVMPGELSGLGLSFEVKERIPGAKIIFTSGFADLEIIQRLQQEGYPLLLKPYRRSQLLALVDQLLAGSEPG